MRSARKVMTVMTWSAVSILGIFTLNAAAKTIHVTDSGDDGPGTFRAAIAEANDDSKIGKIIIKKNVGTIELVDSVVYRGDQDLSIDGKGATIEPEADSEGDFDLFVSDGGADLTLSNLTFQLGANGIFVPVPVDAEGEISVSLKDVDVFDNGLFGLLYQRPGV